MEIEFIKFKKNLEESKLKPTSIKNYISSYNTLQDLFKNDNNYLLNPDKTIKTLNKEYTNNKTLVSKYNIILLLLKLVHESHEKYKEYKDLYQTEYTRIKDEIKEVQEKQEPTEKQLERQISTEQNKKILDTLKKAVKPIKTITDLIPLRNLTIYKYLDEQQGRGDFINSYYVYETPKNTDHNYIYLDKINKKAYYIQNHHKTDKSLAQQTFTLNTILYKLFTRLFNAYKKLKLKNQYAFYQDNGINQMNTDNLSKIYKKIGDSILNIPLSIQIMRTQKTSNDIEVFLPIVEKAHKQGHNMNTVTKHYMKKGLKKL
jgi:hypothetical protein